MRQVSHRRYRWIRDPRDKQPVKGQLVPFSRSLGLDVIVTEQGKAVLIELQHGFGRRGLIELYPEASRRYRKAFWRMRRECGRSLFLAEQMRRICSDKCVTYRHFARYQPPSMTYSRWGPEVEGWLQALDCDQVLVKPPRGSCGSGIEVWGRDELLRSRGRGIAATPPLLLQGFVTSRLLPDAQGRGHLGCIRHIVLIHSDGKRLGLTHLPSYWRVAPEAIDAVPRRSALTANISQGAYPERATAVEEQLVCELAGEVVSQLVTLALGLEQPPICESERIEADEQLRDPGEAVSPARTSPVPDRGQSTSGL